MAQTLKRERGNRPLFTNASVNRKHANTAFLAGMTEEEIAKEWPMVWKCVNGQLSQKYHSEYADGTKETPYTITTESVKAAIKQLKASGRKPRRLT